MSRVRLAAGVASAKPAESRDGTTRHSTLEFDCTSAVRRQLRGQFLVRVRYICCMPSTAKWIKKQAGCVGRQPVSNKQLLSRWHPLRVLSLLRPVLATNGSIWSTWHTSRSAIVVNPAHLASPVVIVWLHPSLPTRRPHTAPPPLRSSSGANHSVPTHTSTRIQVHYFRETTTIPSLACPILAFVFYESSISSQARGTSE